MARNREAIRQWHILRALATARLGVSVDTLARDQRVTPRTIRRVRRRRSLWSASLTPRPATGLDFVT